MNLQYRIDLLEKLGKYISSDDESWAAAKERAALENGWFIPEFITLATSNIADRFLQKKILTDWVMRYQLPAEPPRKKTIGIVMAGNIPLVGFHDFVCVFISGHRAVIKPSAKDNVLIRHLVSVLQQWEPALSGEIQFAEMLKGCDAYIATGSNNSSRYFDYYFGKYPHIIRRNRTSAAVLTGNETLQELEALADDVYQYFGLGCRNVTKLYVPRNYDFVPLLAAFKKYNYLADNHKYKNNYDYNLALLILNNRVYMSNESVILVEDKSSFSPISQLHYEYYDDISLLLKHFEQDSDIQCVVGKNYTSFGSAQCPGITDYADGADTLAFLVNL